VRRTLDEKDVKIGCNKVWAEADMSTTITIHIPTSESFTFSAGGLWSDWLPGEETMHYYHSVTDGGPPTPVLSADLRKWRIGQFCLRLVCNVTKSSVKRGVMIKYTVILCPGNQDELAECSPLSQQPGWPGIKLLDGELPLRPTPSRPWQCLVVPFLITGTPFMELAVAPSGDRMRHAIAAIMCKAGVADCHKTMATIQERVERLQRHPLCTSLVAEVGTSLLS
jgi:hypothetical protein